MNKLNSFSNKNKGANLFDLKKNCAICECNGAVKKWTYHFAYNRKAKVCVHCANKFQSPADVVNWLTKNAEYDEKNGKLVNFKRRGLNE